MSQEVEGDSGAKWDLLLKTGCAEEGPQQGCHLSEGLRGQGHDHKDLGGRRFQKKSTVTAKALGQEGAEPGGHEQRCGGPRGWKGVSSKDDGDLGRDAAGSCQHLLATDRLGGPQSRQQGGCLGREVPLGALSWFLL